MLEKPVGTLQVVRLGVRTASRKKSGAPTPFLQHLKNAPPNMNPSTPESSSLGSYQGPAPNTHVSQLIPIYLISVLFVTKQPPTVIINDG
jgi:hypothetical protein